MKIVILSSTPGSQPFTLADSPDPIPMTNLRINGSRNLQEAQFFRAAVRSFYDRGNRMTEVSFDTSRQFNAQLDAEKFLLLHETQLPSGLVAALVTFTAGVAGSGTASRYLPGAVVQSVSSTIRGFTTFHSYRLAGGVMQTTPS